MPKIDSKAQVNDGKRQYILRKYLDLSQKAFALVLGCSERTIRNREKGLSEISQKDRRKIWKWTGVDLVPVDEFADPSEIARQCETAAKKVDIPPRVTKNRSKSSVRANISQPPAKPLNRQRCQLSPVRRLYEGFIDFAYYTSTLTLVVEQTQRTFLGGWDQHHAYHDIVFLVSAIFTLVFFIGVLSAIPWGVKLNDRTA